MINVQIDQQEVRHLYLKKLEEKIKEVEVDLLFWDANELKRRTCMSWNTILNEFFYDKRFMKYKVGGKWRFPADETKRFLLQWLSEQPTH